MRPNRLWLLAAVMLSGRVVWAAAIPTAYPMTAKVSFKHIYVADEANRRVVRVDPTWKAEETCAVK